MFFVVRVESSKTNCQATYCIQTEDNKDAAEKCCARFSKQYDDAEPTFTVFPEEIFSDIPNEVAFNYSR